jgi:hypothetical protein
MVPLDLRLWRRHAVYTPPLAILLCHENPPLKFRLKGTFSRLWFIQCCGSALFWSEFPCWCRSRSGSGLASKRCRSTCRSYPKIYTSLKRMEKLYFHSQQCQFTIFFLFHKWQRCHDFKYFWQHTEMFYKKVKMYVFGIGLESIPVRIRKK